MPNRNTRSLAITVLLSACYLAGCAAQKDAAEPAPEADTSPAASPQAQVRAKPQGPVTLVFAWPDGLRADVVSTSIKAQSVGPQSRTQDLTSDYVMQAERTETGVSINFDQFSVEDPASQGSSAAIANLLAYRPGFAVDEGGQLTQIHGMEVLQPMLETAKNEAAVGDEQAQKGFQIVAQTVTNEQYLKARAGSEWTNLIGAWVGRTLTPGQAEKTQEDAASSGFLDVPMVSKVTTSIAHIEGCERPGGQGCVRLRLTKQPDSDKMREAIRPSLGKLLGVEDWGPEGPPEVESVVATSQLIVDAEPNTLVPHRVEALRVFSVELSREAGPFEVRDSNRTTTTFTYR